MALVLFPISLAMGFWSGYTFLHAANPIHWMRGLLLVIYLFWLFLPMMGYALNDSYDISKLFVFPISMRKIFIGAVTGSILDRPTLLLLPALASIYIGFVSNAVSGIITFIALVTFLIHTLALSQTIMLASQGVLQSRRFRDAALIILPLVSIGYYIIRIFITQNAQKMDWKGFFHSETWDAINFLPPGLAARAIVSAQEGAYLYALGYLAALIIVTATIFMTASILLHKLYLGELIGRPKARAVAPIEMLAAPASSEKGISFPLLDWLPNTTQAIMQKEFRYFFREPYYRAALVNLLIPLVIMLLVSINSSVDKSVNSFIRIWMTAIIMTFSQSQLCYNIFGTEGGAITLLFLFPSSRRNIILGKNLSLFSLLSVLNILFVTIIVSVMRYGQLFGLLLCWTELALIINIGMGNIFSIYFPLRLVMRGAKAQQKSSGKGCSFFLLYLAVWSISIILFLPVMVSILAPTQGWFGIPGIWLVYTIPFAVSYSVIIYLFTLYIANLLIKRQENHIVSRVSEEAT